MATLDSGPTEHPEDRERELVARARARDAMAFHELVEWHRSRALGLAMRVLRSEADAEDVAQEAFVRAWFALPGFRGESKFSTWLYAIVMRKALDRAATVQRRRGRETELAAASEIAATRGADDERARLAVRMERLMSVLSEAQRAVVTLFYYEGRSVDEVAMALRMPAGTVKTHLSRARAALREAWRRDEGEAR